MCVWTKKRGSMNAVVLMATPCPKSLHGKGEVDRAPLKKNGRGFCSRQKIVWSSPLPPSVGTRHGAPRERAGAENGQARRGSPKDGRGR